MRPEAPPPGSPRDWLRFAAGDLAMAKVPLPPGALLENLCFHAQQAGEKAIKAVLVAHGISLPRTHNLRTLLDVLPPSISIPPTVDAAAALTDYSVMGRYPGDFEPIDEGEYRRAVQMAEAVVVWAEMVVGRKEGGGE